MKCNIWELNFQDMNFNLNIDTDKDFKLISTITEGSIQQNNISTNLIFSDIYDYKLLINTLLIQQ